MLSRLDRRPVLWLALGVALVIAAHLRGGAGALGWLAPIPFLRYARVTRGVGSRFALLGAIALGGEDVAQALDRARAAARGEDDEARALAGDEAALRGVAMQA